MVARGATMVASWSLRGAFVELWRHLGATGNSSNNDRPCSSSASIKTSIILTNSLINYEIELYLGKYNHSILKNNTLWCLIPRSQRHFYSGAVRMIRLYVVLNSVFHCVSYILLPRKFNSQWEITNMLIVTAVCT